MEGVPDAPFPVKLTATPGLAGSLLANVMFPDCAPALVGVNRIVNGTVPPAGIVPGKLPLYVNCPGPLTFDTLSAAFPVFETCSPSSLNWPTATLPKSRLDGDTLIEGADAATPVPLRLTLTDGCAGSFVSI